MIPAQPPSVPFQNLPLQIAGLRPKFDEALAKVLSHGQFILGPEVASFEREWAQFCQARHAIGVGSGTDALHLVLRALNIGPGHEVITVANTFIATVEAISYAGATPVLVDCRLEDYLIDPAAVAAAITPRTRAIIPVHLYGQPANMPELIAIAQRHGLALIEDAAQAHGATLADGRNCGTIGTAAAFSFYPGKNLGAFGDAGAITTQDDTLALKLRLLRNWGSVVKYHHDLQGFNSRLDTMQAAVLSVKLPHLPAWNDHRRLAASWYREELENCPDLALPKIAPWTGSHAYHLFVVRLIERNRDEVTQQLSEMGVQTVVHYPIPIHLQKAYAELGHKRGAFPAAETASRNIFSLPMFPEITREQVSNVTRQLHAILTR